MPQSKSTKSIDTLAIKFINNTAKNVFLTGKAGTGKTTFLKSIIRQTYKNAVIVAPTGIAALNAGGVTIHSLFQLPFGVFIPDSSFQVDVSENLKIYNSTTLIQQLKLSANKRKLIQEMELLIVDEVSMLRADLLDAIDTVLKSVRRKQHSPFGGVQVLFIGDLFQLPPVVKGDEWLHLNPYYNSVYFFDSVVLKNSQPLYIELDKIYRQSDNAFISILNNLRTNQVTKLDVDTLNAWYQPKFIPQLSGDYIHLTTHNRKADSLNKDFLLKIQEKSYFFKSETTGVFSGNIYPVDEDLELKKNAQIMFIKNDPSRYKRFYNGKIGIITNISNSNIEVTCTDDNESFNVEKYEWKNIKYMFNESNNKVEETVMGTFTQYPIKLAWAITIHKSQGLTFKKAIIDIGQVFSPGQEYVALSRLTSLNGLILSHPINTNSPKFDNHLIQYANKKYSQEDILNVFDKEFDLFFQEYVSECFSLSHIKIEFKKHIEKYSLKKNTSKYKKFDWVVNLNNKLSKACEEYKIFIKQIEGILYLKKYNYKEELVALVITEKNQILPVLKSFSKDCLKQIELFKSKENMKDYLNDINNFHVVFCNKIQAINKAMLMVNSVNNKE